MATSTVSQSLAPISQAVTVQADYTTAQISNTLASLSQSSTGETIYFVVHDTALATESLLLTYDETLTETALAGSRTYAVFYTDYTDTVVASDELIDINVSLLYDAVAAASSSFQFETTTTLFPKGGKASSEIIYFLSEELTSVATASEVITGLLDDALRSTAAASSSIVTTAELTTSVTGTAWGDGFADFFLGDLLTELAFASSVLSTVNTPTENLTSTGAGIGSLQGVVTTFEELLDTALGADLIVFEGSEYTVSLHDTAVANESLIARDYEAIAWVLNSESTGVTMYDNFGFHSLAEYEGVIYGTSNDGLYALTSDMDESRFIEAEIQTGFLDFDTPSNKRISDLYLGYTGGKLEVDVETYDGPQEVYTYAMEEREANAPRNNRIKVGRGLNSRYWRFTYRNTDGADFQIYDVTAEVASSKRRL